MLSGEETRLVYSDEEPGAGATALTTSRLCGASPPGIRSRLFTEAITWLCEGRGPLVGIGDGA